MVCKVHRSDEVGWRNTNYKGDSSKLHPKKTSDIDIRIIASDFFFFFLCVVHYFQAGVAYDDHDVVACGSDRPHSPDQEIAELAGISAVY